VPGPCASFIHSRGVVALLGRRSLNADQEEGLDCEARSAFMPTAARWTRTSARPGGRFGETSLVTMTWRRSVLPTSTWRYVNHPDDYIVVKPFREGMETVADARERRVVYQHSFKRSQHDNWAINKMIERAEAVADGSRPLKKDRFVKITNTPRVWSGN
jgi:hypothetical protein